MIGAAGFRILRSEPGTNLTFNAEASLPL
jgi:hypothetical protein